MPNEMTYEFTVYGKKNCVGCDAAKGMLDAQGITYEYVDIADDDEARDTVLEEGFRSVPVLYNNLTGLFYGPTEIQIAIDEFEV